MNNTERVAPPVSLKGEVEPQFSQLCMCRESKHPYCVRRPDERKDPARQNLAPCFLGFSTHARAPFRSPCITHHGSMLNASVLEQSEVRPR